MAEGIEAYPAGAHAQITGLASKPELNEAFCVSRGVNPDNPERLLVVEKSGSTLSLRPANLRPAELLPGTRVCIVGIAKAPQYNGRSGEVLSWHGDRWIVDLDGEEKKERKSFRSDNLVKLPEAVHVRRKRPRSPEPEVKKPSATDVKELSSDDETVIGKALARCIREFPLVAMKCICVLATKSQVTVMFELAQHMTERQNDGLIRRVLKPGDKVKGIEELEALEQCVQIAERRVRALAGMCRVNYKDLLGFMKMGCQEPAFNRAPKKP